jgi:hypothetical protein
MEASSDKEQEALGIKWRCTSSNSSVMLADMETSKAIIKSNLYRDIKYGVSNYSVSRNQKIPRSTPMATNRDTDEVDADTKVEVKSWLDFFRAHNCEFLASVVELFTDPMAWRTNEILQKIGLNAAVGGPFVLGLGYDPNTAVFNPTLTRLNVIRATFLVTPLVVGSMGVWLQNWESLCYMVCAIVVKILLEHFLGHRLAENERRLAARALGDGHHRARQIFVRRLGRGAVTTMLDVHAGMRANIPGTLTFLACGAMIFYGVLCKAGVSDWANLLLLLLGGRSGKWIFEQTNDLARRIRTAGENSLVCIFGGSEDLEDDARETASNIAVTFAGTALCCLFSFVFHIAIYMLSQIAMVASQGLLLLGGRSGKWIFEQTNDLARRIRTAGENSLVRIFGGSEDLEDDARETLVRIFGGSEDLEDDDRVTASNIAVAFGGTAWCCMFS